MISSNLNSNNATYITETNTISTFQFEKKIDKRQKCFKMLKGQNTAFFVEY